MGGVKYTPVVKNREVEYWFQHRDNAAKFFKMTPKNFAKGVSLETQIIAIFHKTNIVNILFIYLLIYFVLWNKWKITWLNMLNYKCKLD